MSGLQKHAGHPTPTPPRPGKRVRAGTPHDSAPGGARRASPRLRTAGAEVRVGMPRGQEGEPETGEDRGPRGKASGAIYTDPAREEAGPGRGPAGGRC